MSMRPLRVLNTRPAAQAAALSEVLRHAGAMPIELPLLGIEPTARNWRDTLPSLDTVDQALFVSPNAVACFFNAMAPAQWPASIQTLAIGHGTANALALHNIRVDHMPTRPNSEGVLALPSLQRIQNQTLLLVKGQGGRPLIAETLQARGVHLITAEVYRRTWPAFDKKYIQTLWQHDAIDMIFISSQQALQHLFALFGHDAHAWLCSKPFIVLSTRIASFARDYGVQTILTTEYNALVNTLEGYMHER